LTVENQLVSLSSIARDKKIPLAELVKILYKKSFPLYIKIPDQHFVFRVSPSLLRKSEYSKTDNFLLLEQRRDTLATALTSVEYLKVDNSILKSLVGSEKEKNCDLFYQGLGRINNKWSDFHIQTISAPKQDSLFQNRSIFMPAMAVQPAMVLNEGQINIAHSKLNPLIKLSINHDKLFALPSHTQRIIELLDIHLGRPELLPEECCYISQQMLQLQMVFNKTWKHQELTHRDVMAWPEKVDAELKNCGERHFNYVARREFAVKLIQPKNYNSLARKKRDSNAIIKRYDDGFIGDGYSVLRKASRYALYDDLLGVKKACNDQNIIICYLQKYHAKMFDANQPKSVKDAHLAAAIINPRRKAETIEKSLPKKVGEKALIKGKFLLDSAWKN